MKRRSVYDYLRRNKYDICLLQETHVTNENVNMWSQEWGNKIIFSEFNSSSRGVCTLINPALDYEIIVSTSDAEGRFVIVKLRVHEQTVIIANIYAPNEDTPEYYYNLFNDIENLGKEGSDATIVGGDFNLVMDTNVDRLSSNQNHHRSLVAVQEYMNKSYLCDVWRI